MREALATRKGVIRYQVVQEFFKIAMSRFAKPFSASEAESYFLDHLSSFRPLVVESRPRLFREALPLNQLHRFSWYDSLISCD